MMISPNIYYEFELKGKTQQDLFVCIQSLKKEINALKRELEDPSIAPEYRMMPGPLTMLKCYRDYLQMAIKAYTEAGGIYKPTIAERKDQAFNAALQKIKRFDFTYGGYRSGFEIWTYEANGETMKPVLDFSRTLNPFDLPVNEPYTKKEFIDGIAELHIGEWKRTYDDPSILDGKQWSLEITFEGGHKPVRIHGSNAFPYNFNDLLEFLGIGRDEEEAADED
jgi:hypothetical protein